jgi:RNA polymerase sigma factor (sigma-70 family)
MVWLPELDMRASLSREQGSLKASALSGPADLSGPKDVPASASGASRYRSDPALVQGCLNGEEASWKELVDRYGRLVYSIPRRYGLSQGDAEDVFQNVFTVVLRQLRSLRDPTRLSAWLITITHRQTQQAIKRSANTSSPDHALQSVQDPSLEEIHRWEQRQLLDQAMSQLEPRCRQLLSALFQESKPNYQELAGSLQIAVGSIGPTRARCFKKLESILITLGFEP